jgi:glycosyltransferase involved in cell wall biosynthesis
VGVRVGLIARATDSGLGHLSKDFFDHFGPDETLVITDADGRYQDHREWYPDGWFVRMEDLGHYDLASWMRTVDVVFGYETFYHERVLRSAAAAGVRSVLMGMPELTRQRRNHGFLGDPDTYVWPTSWLLEDLPGQLLAVPVTWRGPRQTHFPLTIVHVAGQPATADRNGTQLFVRALQHLHCEIDVRICAANDAVYDFSKVPDNVQIEVWGQVADRFLMYQECDLLVLPRRYGGLSLPVLEALSCGLAVMMPDTSPQNQDWPILAVPCSPDVPQRCGAGFVPRVVTRPEDLAASIEQAVYDRVLVNRATEAARLWVRENSWAALAPGYEAVLGRACGST